MVVFVMIVIIIIAYFFYNKYEKNLIQIRLFNKNLANLRKSYTDDISLSSIKNNYLSTYRYFSKKLIKTNTIKQFINDYLTLDSEVLKWNIKLLKVEEIKRSYNSYIEKANEFLDKISICTNGYITSTMRDTLTVEYADTYNFFSNNIINEYNFKLPEDFIFTYSNIKDLVITWNEIYIKKELQTYKDFFDNIDGKSLDYQQRVAVVTDDTNNLVLAGAGSGKTLTIAAKVKYLVECKNVQPKDILLISFTKKAAKEMTDRISNKLNIPVCASTFHKFGFDLLKLNSSYIDENLGKIISEYFKNFIINDIPTIQNILNFFLYYLNVPIDLADFDCLGDYIDTQISSDLVTLKYKYNASLINTKINDMQKELNTINGEKVRSIEEVMIANFLFMHGINYEYEKEYPFIQKERPNAKYHPDFYLTDYDIYLEHFGINEDGALPWLPDFEADEYRASMEWKRNFHKENGTKLIETYSYYNKEHQLLSKLETLLKENGVEFSTVDIKDIYCKVYADGEDYHFKEFEKLVQTFIQLFKENGYTTEDFDKIDTFSSNTFESTRNTIFLKIVKPIFEFYQKALISNNKIDYSDMINNATTYITENNLENNYKYIIIDEYQDISFGRYKLVKELINKTGAKLFCVGDDWQSIYRFSGSDLTLFTDFSKYFGETQLLKIEKTYRNSQELLDVAKKFVEMNPEQFSKNLYSDKNIDNPIIAMVYSKNRFSALKQALEDIHKKFGDEADVLLLGRTNYDINNYLNKQIIYSTTNDKITYTPFPNMKIRFLTVHSSKGLEADNVIILNMENTLLGFPNKISDDPVLSLVLQNKDSYPYAEERRIFYVAMTRTRNRVYLIVPNNKQSVFFKDLCNIKEIPIYKNKNEPPIQSNSNSICPRCKRGTLLIREKNGKKFVGCSNYPYCTYTFSDTSGLYYKKKCPKCDTGYLVKKSRKIWRVLGMH